MKLELRDVSIKCKKLRRNNIATGTLRKNDKEIIPISLCGTDMDKYINDFGFNKLIELEFGEEKIEAKILKVFRDNINHNIINVDFQQIN